MIRHTSKLVLRIFLFVWGALIFIGCDYFYFTAIGEITENPLKYEGKEIKVKGKVVESVRVPFTETVIFGLQDEIGKIIIIGTGAKPKEGDAAKVRGVVSISIKIGNDPFGTHLMEKERW